MPIFFRPLAGFPLAKGPCFDMQKKKLKDTVFKGSAADHDKQTGDKKNSDRFQRV